MKKLLILLSLLAAVPLWAGFGSLARPTRPVTDLRCTKDGVDVVLTWTTTPTSAYRYVVCRGVLQPKFRAEKVVAVLPLGSTGWRDYGAITRTVLGVAVNEFYRVYALPGEAPAPGFSRKAKAVRHEYRERPRDRSQVLRMDVSNGSQFNLDPRAEVIGRDNGWQMPGSRSSSSTFLYDMENFPTPGGAVGREVWLSGQPDEAKPNTWLHSGYYAGVTHTPAGGDETVAASTTRELSAPAVSRDGNVVTVTITAPPQDTAGAVQGIQWYRSYLGVADAETMTLLATHPPTTLEIQDDITAVPPNWHVFYFYRLVYKSGLSDFSKSSTSPLRR